MPKRYIVDLTKDERAQLVALTRKDKASAPQVIRAHVLLHTADGLTNAETAVAAHTSVPTVALIRKRFVQGRVPEAITERYRKGGRPKLDLKGQFHLIALSCSTPPQGRTNWCKGRFANGQYAGIQVSHAKRLPLLVTLLHRAPLVRDLVVG